MFDDFPFKWEDISYWAFPLIAFLVASLVGLVLEKYLNSLFKRLQNKYAFIANAELGRSIRGAPMAICLFAGALAVARYGQLEAEPKKVLQDLAVAAVVLSVTISISRIVVSLSKRYGGAFFGDLISSSLFAYVIRISIFIVGFLIVLDTFGISISPMLTALGVGGLAVALALQDTLSNLFAGIQLVITKQVQPGEFIELHNGDSGYVIDISWRATQIRTILYNVVVIPNSKLSSTIMKNYHKPYTPTSIVMRVGVHLDSDMEHVDSVLYDETWNLIQSRPELYHDQFKPEIRFYEFTERAIMVKVIFRVVEYEEQYLGLSEMMKAVHRRLREEGIVMPYPVRLLQMPEGERLALEINERRETAAAP